MKNNFIFFQTCLQSDEHIKTIDPILKDNFKNAKRGQLDVIKMLEDVSHYKYLFIYEDRISRYIVLKALTNNNSKEVAMELLDVFSIIGVPHILQSENGETFAKEVIKELFSLWDKFRIISDNIIKFKNERNFKIIIKSWLLKNPKRTWFESIKFIQVLENATFANENKYPYESLVKINVYDDFYPNDKDRKNSEPPKETLESQINIEGDSSFISDDCDFEDQMNEEVIL